MPTRYLPPLQPPRQTGDAERDKKSMEHWFNALYKNAVEETRLLDPARQYAPDDFDPDNLFDPEDSSIANAQLTANRAYPAVAAAAAAQEDASTAIATSISASEDATLASANASTALTTANAAATAADAAQDDATQALADAAEALDHGSQEMFTIAVAGTGRTGTHSVSISGSYYAMCQVRSFTGTPPDGAFIIESLNHSSTLTLTVRTAPGGSNSVIFQVIIFKLF